MLLDRRKIFVVGFQKAGTSSMKAALISLGYRVTSAHQQVNAVLDPDSPDADALIRRITLARVATSDAIQDSPCPLLFEDFDREYPGSKFILTYRPPKDWLRSYGRYFKNQNRPLRKWMYKVDRFEGNESIYRDVYESQNKKIRDHFRNRPADFIEMDLGKGHGWYELVTFLGRDFLPSFPKRNVGKRSV